MSRRTLLTLALLTSLPASALPQYPHEASDIEGSCTRKTSKMAWTGHGQYVDDVVYVYISEDFASDWDTEVGGDPMSQDQARQLILSSMEVWNRESRGPALVYAGEADGELSDYWRLYPDSCSTFLSSGGPGGTAIKTPAVLISPDPDTKPLDDGGKESGSVARLHDRYGNLCSTSSSPLVGMILGGNDDVRQLRPTVIHEFGHVLGLGHTFDTIRDSAGELDSEADNVPMGVMSYDTDGYNDDASPNMYDRAEWRAHLWPWDADCVDDDLGASSASASEDARQRELKYHWRTYEVVGNDWGTSDYSWHTTSHAFSSGTVLPGSSTDHDRYPLVYWGGSSNRMTWEDGADVESWTDADLFVDLTDHAATLHSQQSRSTLPVVTYGVLAWTSPTWRLANAENGRDYLPDHNDVDDQDPPLWRKFTSTSDSSGTPYRICASSGCSTPWGGIDYSSTTELRSHVPLRANHDPRTSEPVFATVTTRECSTDGTSWSGHTTSSASCGAIRVHGGLEFTSTARDHVLPFGDTVGGSGSMPGYYDFSPDDYDVDYTGTTHVAPAIACAPGASSDWDLPHSGNCLIAWVDAGTPDNHILYTYFRLGLGNSIQWRGGVSRLIAPVTTFDADGDKVSTGTRGRKAQSASDLTAVFNDGRFYIAYKSSMEGYENHPVVARTAFEDLDYWEVQHAFIDDETVEAPTLIADPRDEDREATLVWNVLDE